MKISLGKSFSTIKGLKLISEYSTHVGYSRLEQLVSYKMSVPQVNYLYKDIQTNEQLLSNPKKKKNAENKNKSSTRLYRTSIKLWLINCGILIDSHW